MKIKSKVTKNRKQIMNRLQKYTLGAQGMAVLSGLLGQTAISSAVVQALNVSAIINKTTIGGGGGSLGDQFDFDLVDSVAGADKIRLLGEPVYQRLGLFGYGGADVLNFISTNGPIVKFYPVGDAVTGDGNIGSYGDLSSNGNNVSPWDEDHLTGAIGFRNGDFNLGFINISWVAATQTLTYLGGMFEADSGVTSIVVTAIPEHSDYAAALGLGALGLAYYRRRPGNKSRAKK